MAIPLAITADNRGPLVNIATWLSLVAMIIITLTKLATKWTMAGRFQADDGLMTAAGLVGIAQALAAWQQVENGLGQHRSAVGDAQFENFEKATYAAQVLYIVSTNLAKLAVLYLLYTFTRSKLRRRAVQVIFGFTVSWTLLSVLVIIFQCPPPQVWEIVGSKCVNMLAFWAVYAVMDILVQLVIGLLPVFLLWELHTQRAKKLVAMGAFTPNLLTIPLVVLRLVYLFMDVDDEASDPTYSSFNTALIMEIHTMLAIIAACLPFTKPLIDSLSTGLLGSDLRSTHGGSSRGSRFSRFMMLSNSTPRAGRSSRGYLGPSLTGNLSPIGHGDLELTETFPEISEKRDKMVINRTITTTVKFEEEDKLHDSLA